MLKKMTIFAAMLAGATVFTTLAFADYIPLPIKWSQPIGYDPLDLIIGKDRLSDHTVGVVRADDFICNDPLPIMAVRWWGSYIGSTVHRPDGFTGPFDISFHLSTYPFEPHPLSRPDSLLLLQTVSAQEVFVGFDQVGDAVYRYDAYLNVPFNQQPGREYFIDIDKPTQENWGWHESPFGGLDFPAVAPAHPGPWANDPPHDLAFELMVIPEPSVLLLAGLGGGLLFVCSRWRRMARN